MSNEQSTVTYSLEGILREIQSDLAELKVGQARLEERLSGEIRALDEKLSGEIRALDEKLSGEIRALDEKVDGISKRLDNQEFLNRGVIVGLIVAILGGLAKIFGFIGNP